MSTVGVIVNPLAGKDIRRLVANASPVSDAAKIGSVRRAVSGAIDAGATRLLIAGDHHHLGRRAVEDLERAGCTVEIVDDHVRGGRDDTVAVAGRFAKQDVGAVVVFGGDGTHRDVASGWPAAPMVAVSTGTNNVFPVFWDATSAGAAAAFVAAQAVDFDHAARTAKLVSVRIIGAERVVDDVALVDVALVSGSFIGSRAVWDPTSIISVVAAIASPASTGLASIAGRAHPVGRWEPHGAVVSLGPGGRRLRIPLAPGSFVTVEVAASRTLPFDETVVFDGPGVITLDGERSHVLARGERAEVRLGPHGPSFIDVDSTLSLAAAAGCFDVAPTSRTDQENTDVD
ncbi:NAD(+)/NADH kinase [soil metagenome]